MVNYQKAFQAVVTDPQYLANLDWGKPREGHSEGTVRAHIRGIERNHASLARELLSRYCNDEDLLMMVQYHDEPFALYRQYETRGKYNQDRLANLLNSISDWNLFLAFNIIDGCTSSKSREPLYWLFREVAGRVDSRFTADDIMPTVQLS